MANLQSLVALLQATQSIHAGERVAAEQNLTVASRNPEFCVALATLLADENNAVPLRQLAGVMLKQFASRNWATLPGEIKRKRKKKKKTWRHFTVAKKAIPMPLWLWCQRVQSLR